MIILNDASVASRSEMFIAETSALLIERKYKQSWS